MPIHKTGFGYLLIRIQNPVSGFKPTTGVLKLKGSSKPVLLISLTSETKIPARTQSFS